MREETWRHAVRRYGERLLADPGEAAIRAEVARAVAESLEPAADEDWHAVAVRLRMLWDYQ